MRQEQLQQQRLIISPKMKQSLYLLKLPVTELSAAISMELDQNPLLEVVDPEEFVSDITLSLRKTEEGGEKKDIRTFIENSYAEEESLFIHLLAQAKECFYEKEELAMAEELIGNINEKGLFEGNLREISTIYHWSEAQLRSILHIIQSFDPPGIGALTIQDCLLLQLEYKGLKESLSYRIVKDYYEHMLHNRIQLIAKSLGCDITKIYSLIESEISSLEINPGKKWQQGHYKEAPISITTDVHIEVNDSSISIDVNQEKIPHLRINEEYLKLLMKEESKEAKTYLQEKLHAGNSLLKNLYERNQTLYRIAEEIAVYQSAYFLDVKAQLLPMTMKELGERLSLHESTIARATSGKYVSTPRGVVAMRTFFTHGYQSLEGDKVSSTSIKELVKEIIEKENKMRPYSDDKIAELIQKKGVHCARRTIAKYRKELGLGNRGQRKLFS
jgi:RNA polymerase sigma-54 factor